MQISVPSGVSTIVEYASGYTNMEVSADGVLLYDVSYCGPAALYYQNSRGGIDAFLVEGGCKRTDKYTQSDYYKTYDNTTIEFGRNRYLTEITPQWELSTGWLADDEAERLCRNLLPSTMVWLHLLDEDEIYPVVINDQQAEYKTYENQKNQLVYYKINVAASQNGTRA